MDGAKMALLGLALCPGILSAQNSSRVKALKVRKNEVQQKINRSQTELNRTRKDVDSKIKSINFIDVQLESRLRYINEMEQKMLAVDKRIHDLEQQVRTQEENLEKVKKRYKQSLVYARTNQAVQSPLIFIFSAKSVTQMYRRARYAREYAQYQRALGEQIGQKQKRLLADRGKLLAAKGEMAALVRETLQQRKLLFEQQQQQKEAVAGLQKHEKVLVDQINRQQRELAELDRKIDAVIAEEIEKARRRAEAERKRKAAEEAARKARAQAAQKKKSKTRAQKTDTRKTATKKNEDIAGGAWRTPVDNVLSSNFQKNKGRLPVPITGSYMISGHFGTYNVPGLKNVRLDNKGTNFVGQKGARARAIFDGEVTAVFQYSGTYNVLIRHGSYISVYCNLSSVIVRNGQTVRTRDLIGAVAEDGSGKCVLHFQLRKERTKLNPEQWIGR
ncbi:MAG: peptidoglycan DD-metalloendopeptidase family protein [Candidatus Paraprevotella stercoravium]|uniref:Peptidoglycan DD-metalloendopeptidase family protein n=2 Tax=Bacteroidales TaxID=171549 RepID=A0ABT7U4F0_9BACE|nr:peptidoglycan DD-metalloendopeptidase family protein [Candidatus Paraprevotella stercoravium]MDM8145408.1 peptidoglycan DD-metalloendopeptidase family protein [Bacteroides eggerthii]